MSQDILTSQGLLLDDLSKEILYCLNNHPMLAIPQEKIEYFCSRFQLLFNGDYRLLRFQTTMLHSFIMQYCECILLFVQDNAVSVRTSKVDCLKRWLSVLDNLEGDDSIKCKFTLFMPVVQNLIFEDLPLWITKEFMLHLNRIFEKPTQLIFNKKEKKLFFSTVERIVKLIITCGDYELQTILVEAIISTCELCHIEEILVGNFGDTNRLTRMFLRVYDKQNYVNDLKSFLTAINDCFYYVRSVPCSKVILEETVILPIKGMNGGDDTWMHVNYGFRTLSFVPGLTTNSSNSVEFVTINFENIDKICLLINNNAKTVNSVGGIFFINLVGNCSYRFESSKEIVSLITKITLTVPDGSHMQLLKNIFIILFGGRFKEDNKIPIKKRNYCDKWDSLLHSSTPNSSYRAENRKTSKKINDAMSSLGSDFPKNSIILENKQSVLGATKDCLVNFTKPSLIVDKKSTNSQLATLLTTRLTTKSVSNKENKSADLNIKIVTCSSRNQEAGPSASITTSNTKTQDLQKSFNLSKITSKLKKNTSGVISNNPSNRLPKSCKKGKENRRIQKKQSIDKSKPVGSLLCFSKNVESTKTSKEIREDIDLKNKENEHLSLETVEINNESFPRNTLDNIVSQIMTLRTTEEQTRNADINILSVSSMEEFDFDASTVVDFQLLNESFVTICNDLQEGKNEVARLNAELSRIMKKIEELELRNKDALEVAHHSELNKARREKSDSPKKKLTKEQIASQSEVFNGNKDKSFQKFIESSRNCLPDKTFVMDKFISNDKINKYKLFDINDEEPNYFEKLEKPLKGLPAKKFLLNKFILSQSKNTPSTLKANKSMESNFEMLIARNELNSQELIKLSPKMSLFDMISSQRKEKCNTVISSAKLAEGTTMGEEDNNFLNVN